LAVLSILQVTFPFFALVLCGYVATRRRMLPLEAIGGLNSFVLFFALPCMLYRFGASTPIAQMLDATLFGVYLLCSLALVGLTVLSTRRGPAATRLGWNDTAFGALVAAFPNTGFMGVPLLVALLGAQVVGPTIVTLVADMVFTSSLCIALSRLDGAGQHGVAQALRNALRGVVANPMPWSILLGGLASVLGFSLPAPLQKTVSPRGAASTCRTSHAVASLAACAYACAPPSTATRRGPSCRCGAIGTRGWWLGWSRCR